MQLGQTIIKIRKENELTQEEFAKRFNVTRQTVSNWENEKSYPDLVTLVKISDEFDCTLDAMLKENPDMTEKMNKNMKYGESSALMGGICSICLFINAIEMIILQVGSWYWCVFMLLICAVNVEAVNITLNQAKAEGKKSVILLGLFYLAYAIISFGVLWYIR